ncbi:MAG TPA: hypothetical protein VFP12_14045 [Allosphingosinicella sp.]|nr:hypothetical protein [Allosphingosinicella sp.]
MSGQLVMTEHGDTMSFYMVGLDKPDDACGEVNRRTGLNNAHALAPVTDEILDHHEVRRGNAWLYRSMQISTGEVAFSRLDQTAL